MVKEIILQQFPTIVKVHIHMAQRKVMLILLTKFRTLIHQDIYWLLQRYSQAISTYEKFWIRKVMGITDPKF